MIMRHHPDDYCNVLTCKLKGSSGSADIFYWFPTSAKVSPASSSQPDSPQLSPPHPFFLWPSVLSSLTTPVSGGGAGHHLAGHNRSVPVQEDKNIEVIMDILGTLDGQGADLWKTHLYRPTSI